MCKGTNELKKSERNKGALNKERENIQTMYKNGFDPETIAKALSLDINYVKEVLTN